MTTATTQAKNVEQKAETIKTMLQAQTDENGEVSEPLRVQISVEYENRRGNMSTKEGEIWRVTDGWINFSQNIGQDNEDPYYIEFKYGSVRLVSVSERGSESELGEVSNISIDS